MVFFISYPSLGIYNDGLIDDYPIIAVIFVDIVDTWIGEIEFDGVDREFKFGIYNKFFTEVIVMETIRGDVRAREKVVVGLVVLTAVNPLTLAEE